MIHEMRIDKLDFIKVKIFCSAKDNVMRIKRQTRLGDRIYKIYIKEGIDIQNIQGTLRILKTQTNPLKNGLQIKTDTSPKKIYRAQLIT